MPAGARETGRERAGIPGAERQPAARAQHSGRLGRHRARIREVLEHVPEGERREAARGERQPQRIAHHAASGPGDARGARRELETARVPARSQRLVHAEAEGRAHVEQPRPRRRRTEPTQTAGEVAAQRCLQTGVVGVAASRVGGVEVGRVVDPGGAVALGRAPELQSAVPAGQDLHTLGSEDWSCARGGADGAAQGQSTPSTRSIT